MDETTITMSIKAVEQRADADMHKDVQEAEGRVSLWVACKRCKGKGFGPFMGSGAIADCLKCSGKGKGPR